MEKGKYRADHYEEKLSINGSFEDVINVSVNKVPEKAIESKEKKEEEKPVQKRKNDPHQVIRKHFLFKGLPFIFTTNFHR